MNKSTRFHARRSLLAGLVLLLVSACQPVSAPQSAFTGGPPNVLAVETFLADLTQQVAGSRLQVGVLIPIGLDPHSFEPTPNDVVRISQSQVLVVNGAGFEEWLKKTLTNADGSRLVIEASNGLTPRTPKEGEALDPAEHPLGDPHFWLDPTETMHYIETIRDGLTQVDPAGKEIYAQNASAYLSRLKDLDAWIVDQIKIIPPERRLLVTNHESLGYFADRYGFTITGTIIPSTSTSASPSAQQLARLIDRIKASHAPAIFLETGTNPQLADQVARETGIKVVTDLYTHSITPPGGNAADYITMMKWDVQQIVNALK